MAQRYDVFLSYNVIDIHNVTKLANILKDAGLRVWFTDWEERTIQRADRLFSALSKALDECSSLLVLIGPHGIESFPQTELATPFERAAQSTYRIIPVLLPGSQPTAMPMFLRTRVYCDLREWNKTELSKLIYVLRPAPMVFICHAKEDEMIIERLFHYLKGRGLDPWYDKKSSRSVMYGERKYSKQ